MAKKDCAVRFVLNIDTMSIERRCIVCRFEESVDLEKHDISAPSFVESALGFKCRKKPKKSRARARASQQDLFSGGSG